ncbi:MAG: hypothetical protein ACM3ZV_04550 [Bacillota bacterium]
MDFFNYVMVLASVIVGLAVAHLLQGVARMVQEPERGKLYWVHLLWIALMFHNALFWWWWEFGLSRVSRWTFELYLFVLYFAVLLYVICAVLVPRSLGGYADYRAYYFSRRRWLFGLLLAFSLLDFVDSAVKGWQHLTGLGWPYFVSVLVRTLLMLVAFKSRSGKVHGAIVVLFLANLALLAFLNFHTMQ